MKPTELVNLLLESNIEAIKKIIKEKEDKDFDFIKYNILFMVQRNLRLLEFCNKYFNNYNFYQIPSKQIFMLFVEIFRIYGIRHNGHLYWKRKLISNVHEKYSNFNNNEITNLLKIEEYEQRRTKSI